MPQHTTELFLGYVHPEISCFHISMSYVLKS